MAHQIGLALPADAFNNFGQMLHLYTKIIEHLTVMNTYSLIILHVFKNASGIKEHMAHLMKEAKYAPILSVGCIQYNNWILICQRESASLLKWHVKLKDINAYALHLNFELLK